MTSKKDDTEYTKYIVAFDPTGRHIEIILDGYEPSTGHRKIGSFGANPIEGKLKGDDDFDTHGDHILIAKAKEIVGELGVTDYQNMVYEDKASNAPSGNSYIPTIAEVERAVRDGENPGDLSDDVSENIDKAEAAMDKQDKAGKTKSGTKTKNDAKPRTNG